MIQIHWLVPGFFNLFVKQHQFASEVLDACREIPDIIQHFILGHGGEIGHDRFHILQCVEKAGDGGKAASLRLSIEAGCMCVLNLRSICIGTERSTGSEFTEQLTD